MWQAWGKRKMYEGFWWGILKGKDNFKNLGVDRSLTLIFT
jgi:hypothetical protein